MTPKDPQNAPLTPDSESSRQRSGFRLVSDARLADATSAAIEMGQRIAREYGDLDRGARNSIARVFRAQLMPPGRPGKRRSKEITAAYADWSTGMRGIALYTKHIPGFDKMNNWKRQGKAKRLVDAIRKREARTRSHDDSSAGPETKVSN